MVRLSNYLWQWTVVQTVALMVSTMTTDQHNTAKKAVGIALTSFSTLTKSNLFCHKVYRVEQGRFIFPIRRPSSLFPLHGSAHKNTL